MSESALEATLANFSLCEEAYKACLQAGMTPARPRLYKDKAALGSALHSLIREKINEPNAKNQVAEAATELYKESRAIWMECLEFNLKRCDGELSQYQKFVDKKRLKLRAINLSPHSQHYTNEISSLRAKLVLVAAQPIPTNYLESWKPFFDECTNLNSSIVATHLEMWNWIDKGLKDQEARRKTTVDRIRTGAAVGGFGSGAIAALWALLKGSFGF